MPALDGLRAIAIVAVMSFHYLPGEHHWLVLRWFYWATHSGWIGVDLFFVLSGFLITGLLLDAKGSDGFFRTFYIRRTLRIFPVYYATLAIVFGLLAHVPGFRTESFSTLEGEQIWLWTYLVNWVDAIRHQLVFVSDQFEANHFWSLAVEEQFYLVWPAVVFALSRRRLVQLGAAMIGASFLLRPIFLPSPLTLQVVRADGLVLGGLLAVGLRDAEVAPHLKRFAPRGALTIVFFARHGLLQEDPWMRAVGLAIAQIGCGAAVIAAVGLAPDGTLHRLLCARPLALLARYSYAIYIFHWAFAPWFRRFADVLIAPPWTRIAIADQVLHALFFGLLSLAMAVVSYFVLEQPFLRLKDRWAPTHPRLPPPRLPPPTFGPSEPRLEI
jgi:peptidoglycan/LPS O-acetylase OafA/YrhL